MKPFFSNSKVTSAILPYFKKYKGKIFVIKYGGAAMTECKLKETFAQDVLLLKKIGIKVVIVHGGGKEITALSKKLNLHVKFINGLRYTDLAAMEIVLMVLAGKTNKEIVSNLNKYRGNAVGLCGIDANLLKVKKFIKNNQELGFVGEIQKVNTDYIRLLLSNNYLPVIAPVGISSDFEAFNINADEAASAIASSLKAKKLIYVTDVSGIVVNGKIVSNINSETANELINNCKISNGMIPKITSAFKAIKSGVNKVHLINGTIKNSLLTEILTNHFGTEIVDPYKSLKRKRSDKKCGNVKLAS